MPSRQRTKARQRSRRGRKGMCGEDRPILEPNAAGIDIGAREIFVAVPPDRDEHPVGVFDSFTEDLHQLADWLMTCGITTVAMESTGVYWIALYEILETRGLKPCLVDARHVDAIVSGERDPMVLAQLRDPRVKASEETIRKSLVGNWRAEHRFTLKQSREMYPALPGAACTLRSGDRRMLGDFEPRVDPDERPLPPDRKRHRSGKKRRKKNGHPNPGYDLRTEAYKLFGVDVTQIPGLETLALSLFSELGRDMSRWRRRPVLYPGWRCARTTKSAGAVCCGKAYVWSTTEPGRCSGWQPTRCITVKHRWAIICAG